MTEVKLSLPLYHKGFLKVSTDLLLSLIQQAFLMQNVLPTMISKFTFPLLEYFISASMAS